MMKIRKQMLVTPKIQDNGQTVIFSKNGQWLRREETPIKLPTPANEANTKFWGMVGRGVRTLE